MAKQYDFSYSESADGLYSVLPNNPQAIEQWNRNAEILSCRMFPIEFQAFCVQIRQAGYSVGKAKPSPELDELSGDELLALLAV